MELNHLRADGTAHMIDVSEKTVTARAATASGTVRMAPHAVQALRGGTVPKGDALGVARLAGIQAAKRTDELIPLAHPLPLEQVEVELTPGDGEVRIVSRVVVTARTGAEMEALTACSAAALALYDMVKAVAREARITDLQLEAKSGGRSGDYRRGAPDAAR